MIKKILLIVTIITTISICQVDVIKTVDSVDLQKYTGKWYEIAKIPNSFQDHCEKNTTANYEIKEDGDIIVTNSCINFDNEIDEAEGLAKVVDTQTNSKLEVSFVSILGWHIFWGDYWILGLEKDYQYAVIGTPSRKYAWILSRTQNMNEKDLEACYKIFENNGFNRSKFEISFHE